ncbi:hypothetical protein C8259_12895 [Nocardia nova]|uniref:Uncharacterized protein n=1 Tax=Nocardia nova TaxID=37330 RepID=A0A2T2Z712_9NOCA|nr:hypothetical protein C8259_12895 [Nocardia nova]
MRCRGRDSPTPRAGCGRSVYAHSRAAHIHDEVARILPAGHLVGVYLRLPVAAWAQTEDD